MSEPGGRRPAPASDLAIVSGQLGRTAREVTGVAVRCPFDRPAVIETAPVLAGEPNPTLLYLTCPSATTAISRLESKGGVRRFKALCEGDPELSRTLEVVTRAYRRRRASLAAAWGAALQPRPNAGIGGPAGPHRATCLHAYAAALLAARSGWFDTSDEEGHQTPGVAMTAGAAVVLSAAPATGAAVVPGAAAAAAQVWERFLPPRESLWCSDDRCARWDVGESAGAGEDAALQAAAPGDAAPQAAAPSTGCDTRRRVAAIDVGTISVRLLVADLVSGRPETVVRRTEITRLGEGLRPGGALAEAAVRRTRAVVAGYADEARRLGAESILIAGTSASRDAADGAAFVRALGEENGAAAFVLSGAEEAARAYAGASMDMTGDFVLLDVGGGSTELTGRVAAGGVESVSLDLGASRATERWIQSDPPTREELEQVAAEARRAVEPLRARFGDCETHLVGVAGTVTTLACLDARLDCYSAEAIHLLRLSLEAIDALVARLSVMTVAERAALPCVEPGRAPVIVGGTVILKAAMEALGFDELTVSERDLLDGLVLAAPC